MLADIVYPLGGIMRRFHCALLAAVAVFGFASVASAADLPVKAPAYKAPVVVPYNWTGFYIGGSAGYAWMNSTDEITVAPPTSLISSGSVPSSVSLDPNGFIGGAQVGYNWQAPGTMWVYGIEGDISWANLDKTVSAPGGPDTTGVRVITAQQKLDSLGTLRGRLGWTPADRVLLFVTGGLAVGHGSLSTALTRLPPSAGCVGGANNCAQGSVSDTKAGWTIGGGLEWAFANNWSVKAEYLYFDIGSLSHTMTDPNFPAIIFNASADFKGSIARAGVNYHF